MQMSRLVSGGRRSSLRCLLTDSGSPASQAPLTLLTGEGPRLIWAPIADSHRISKLHLLVSVLRSVWRTTATCCWRLRYKYSHRYVPVWLQAAVLTVHSHIRLCTPSTSSAASY